MCAVVASESVLRMNSINGRDVAAISSKVAARGADPRGGKDVSSRRIVGARAISIMPTLGMSALLAACGGGGGAGPQSTPPPPPGPPPPLPGAGADVGAVPAGPLAATGNVLANDTPATGQNGAPAVSAVAVQGGAAGVVGQPIVTDFGTLTLNSNGSYTYLPSDSASTRALVAGQTHTDVFTYTVTNSSGSATGTLSLSVTGVNDAPIAAADTAALVEDAGTSTVSGNVLANDSDPDAGAQLAVAQVGGHASNVGQVIAGTYGSVKLNADGSYTYTLDNADSDTQRLAAGQTATETFSFVVSDNAGGTAQSSLAIRITGANDAPTAAADSAVVTEDDAANTIAGNVLTNDSDPDAGTQLRVAGVDGQAANLGQAITGTYGSLKLSADGSYVYTLDNADPDTDGLKSGQTGLDIFSYQVSDGAGGTSTAQISVTVKGGTRLDASDDVVTIDGSSGAGASFNLFANDDGTAFQLSQLQMPNGTGVGGGAMPTGLSSTAGTLIVAADGTATYSLAASMIAFGAGQSFTDVFSYTVRDALGQSDTATVRITISRAAGHVVNGSDASDNLTAGLIDTVLNGGGGDDVLVGSYGGDVLNGGAGNDRLVGWVGDMPGGRNLANRDQFWGGAGDDIIIGGDGYLYDSAVYSGKRSDYSVQVTGSRVIVRDLNPGDGDDGTDTLTGIELLQFADQNIHVPDPNQYLRTAESGIRDYAIDLSGGAFSVGRENGASLFYYAPATVQLLDFDGGAVPSWLGFDLPSQRLVGSAPAGFEGLVDIVIQPATSAGLGKSDTARLYFYAPRAGDAHGISGVAETFTGTAGDDRVFGMGRGDRATASQGADVYEGAPSENSSGAWPLIDYSGSGAGIYLDLNLGIARGGFAEGDILLNIGSVIGTAFDDTFIASSTSDVIDLGAGDDYVAVGGTRDYNSAVGYVRVWGGAGADVIAGLGSSPGVEVNYSRSAAGISVAFDQRASGGDAEGDLLINISKIIGSEFDDVIKLGSPISGSFSHGWAEGGSGNDFLEGTNGYNSLDGGNGNDQLFGRAGDDQLTGGSGADLIDGGAGVDTVNYSGIGPVQVDLTAGTARGGDAEGDTLIGIENIRSSFGADILRGNAADNNLWGQQGNDHLYGMGGNDILGLYGRSSTAHIDGGDGIDTLRVLDLISVDLAAGTAIATFGGSLTLVSVENVNVYGSGTTVYGDGGSNRLVSNADGDVFLYGRGGDDELVGDRGNDFFVGGEGADKLRGGFAVDQISNGIDTVSYADSAAGVRVDMRIGKGFGGDAEGDTLYQIDNVEGSAGADILIGNNNVADLVSSLRGLGGDDILLAIGDNVTLIGDAGNDLLIGGMQNGGAGNDLLVMLDNGQQTITGGAGADTYVFDTALDKGSGGFNLTATITDFSRADGDKLDLSDMRDGSGNALDLQDILNSSAVTGGNLVIDLSGFTSDGKSVGGSLTLAGINDSGSLASSDFIFIDGIDWQAQLPPNLPLS